MNEEEKGFRFTNWLNPHVMEEKISYRCIGFDLETGNVSEWIQDRERNRIADKDQNLE